VYEVWTPVQVSDILRRARMNGNLNNRSFLQGSHLESKRASDPSDRETGRQRWGQCHSAETLCGSALDVGWWRTSAPPVTD
jgi:hypothetical protein